VEIRDWREFYALLVIRPMPGEQLPLPTVADLDRFEAEVGFRLPQSYRDYMLVFGPGRLLADWDIAGPGNGTWLWDLHRLDDLVRPREDDLDLYPGGEHDRIRRLRYFARMYKDAFGWDHAEVCDPDSSEYAVYRLTEDNRVVRVGGTFRAFVEDAVLDMLTLPGWDEARLGPWLVFEPAARNVSRAEPGAAADRAARRPRAV
jgi:hypothetical protein